MLENSFIKHFFPSVQEISHLPLKKFKTSQLLMLANQLQNPS